nr:hypothetical protein [Tanacetum cinerariifolium]
MTSFGDRLNPRYTIKECSSCGALYTRDCSCSKGSVEDKILVPKPPKNCARCAKCGHPVKGPYCQGCSLLREKLEEDLVTYLKYFQESSESSDDSTNVVNAPREPFVIKQDQGVNPPQIDKCCCECGEALDGIYCQRCICKSCGKGAHTGYNCPPKVLIISNPEPCNQTMNIELPQTLPSFDSTCYSEKESSCQPSQYTVDHPIFDAHNDFLKSQNELSIAQNTIMEQMTQLTTMCEMVCQIFQKKQEEKRIEEEQAANARYWKIPACCDDDDDYDSAITPILSTEETDNSLSTGDEHLGTILTTESDEVIMSSVEDLVPIPSETEGILETMCDVHLNNPTPLEAKNHFETVINSKDDISSSDDDSLYENIEYVEASPHDSEVVSLEVAEIVTSKVDAIEDDNPRKKLLSVHLLIANIEALKDNPTQAFELLTKSSSTSLKSFLEETNTFIILCLNLKTSALIWKRLVVAVPLFFLIYLFRVMKLSISMTIILKRLVVAVPLLILMFLFLNMIRLSLTLLIRSSPMNSLTSYLHRSMIVSTFWNFPDPGELMSILNSEIRENLSTTRVNLPVEDDHSPLLAYVVWIFVAYLTYPVIPPYLHLFENEDTIFDPGIAINRFYSFKPGLSHRAIEGLTFCVSARLLILSRFDNFWKEEIPASSILVG